MYKDTKIFGHDKALACESRGFVSEYKKRMCQLLLTHPQLPQPMEILTRIYRPIYLSDMTLHNHRSHRRTRVESWTHWDVLGRIGTGPYRDVVTLHPISKTTKTMQNNITTFALCHWPLAAMEAESLNHTSRHSQQRELSQTITTAETSINDSRDEGPR